MIISKWYRKLCKAYFGFWVRRRAKSVGNDIRVNKKSSVSVAMKNLRENGFISMDDGGYIKLTEKGLQIAETMLERHTLLSEWLIRIGVDKDTAVEDACRMEHIISAESFEAIKKQENHIKL